MRDPHQVEAQEDAPARYAHEGVVIVQDRLIQVHVVDGNLNKNSCKSTQCTHMTHT